MTKFPNARLVLVVTILVMFTIAWQNPGLSKEKVTIAVVRDGPSREDVYTELIEAELRRLVAEDAEVVFKTDPSFDAQWDLNRIRSVIQNAMNDREVDIVLAIGSLVTQEAGKPDLDLADRSPCPHWCDIGTSSL